jgi:hypothetical protein
VDGIKINEGSKDMKLRLKRIEERHHIAHDYFLKFMSKTFYRDGWPRTEEGKDIHFDRRFFYTLGFKAGKRIGRIKSKSARKRELHYGR